MAPDVAPYGTWISPVSANTLTERTVTLSQVRIDGPDIYWVEDNPRRQGRSVLLRRNALAQTSEVLPMLEGSRLVNVCTHVHERGGRAYAVKDGVIVISDGLDNRVYAMRVADRKRELRPLTPLTEKRYGDFEIDLARGVVYAICEDHRGVRAGTATEPKNSLVAIPIDGSAARDGDLIIPVFEGTDFVSAPTASPDGTKLAWLTWSHPEMPWTKSELHVGQLDDRGHLTSDVILVDHPGVCAYEPRWTLEGDLIHVDDSTGWANFYRTEGFRGRADEPADAWETRLRTRALHPGPQAFSRPHWQLGLHSYDNFDTEHLVCSWAEGEKWHIGTIRLDNGLLEEWDIGWEPLGNVASAQGRVVFLGHSPTETPAVIEILNAQVHVIRPSSEAQIDESVMSRPQNVTWTNRDGSEGYGVLYPPVNSQFEAPAGDKPPLLVSVHPVPTTSARRGLTVAIQYWTSRGFAVLEPNYRGSTGFGREYREALNGKWGEVDVTDCVDATKSLIYAGIVDPLRVAIRGESFGGLTVLLALENSEVFSAGAVVSGITNLDDFLKSTHKFEAHYPQRLMGTEDLEDPVWRERAPQEHLNRITAPVLFIHGTDDEFVSVHTVEEAYATLVSEGKPAAIELLPDEGHIFMHDRSVELSWQTELSFYGKVWGFEVDQQVDLDIANFS